jgi:methylenetetrahydrofolate dehydrogenase (NADP+)/methenyltetrahydrofolate cyclohydrolase
MNNRASADASPDPSLHAVPSGALASDTLEKKDSRMAPKILDGKSLAKAVGRTLLRRTEVLSGKIGRSPGLAVILVGDNPASKTYVAAKHKFAKECGVTTFDAHVPAAISAHDLQKLIEQFNADPAVDGILLQLPLPAPLDGAAFTRMIAPEKDADGLHPYNQGMLLQGATAPRPCTPLGVMTMLDLAMSSVELHENTTLDDLPRASLAGKSAVVIGRSQLVGKPMGFLLLERNATVTFAHSKTKDLPQVCREADVVVAAVGVPQLVKRDWIKPGAIVLDVGINRTADGKLVGDVDYDDVVSVASAITPVPGGVGPMTVAMLMANTVENCARNNGVSL